LLVTHHAVFTSNVQCVRLLLLLEDALLKRVVTFQLLL